MTAINFVICYPLAYYMAQAGAPQRVRLILLGLVVPYWVNEILRAFSLRLLLATKGLINNVLVGAGIIDTPIDFLGQNVGLYVGLSYAYLLVMIFPLYNAIESLDKNQIEAARDLGAPWWRIHKDVVIPYAAKLMLSEAGEDIRERLAAEIFTPDGLAWGRLFELVDTGETLRIVAPFPPMAATPTGRTP